ncbi:MAG: Methionine--tRNA ligase [Methanobacteriota archaeon]|nr:MAG: Methionine--tRNA ligase [Euryarchaeota archaeon]
MRLKNRDVPTIDLSSLRPVPTKPKENSENSIPPEHVMICVAWPYANGPLHLGHVAGCYLPPDIQFRFERALGNKVLMVSGSDEHGTPITVAAEQQNVPPQEIVDKYHVLNKQALLDLGCSWDKNIDERGIDYGGALFNRTSDLDHKKYVKENFLLLHKAGLFEQKTMQQYFEVQESGGRFLPDRYVEGNCPTCDAEGARGDQCDTCGATYEATELINPKSKMNPEAKIEIRDTEHFFYRLDKFQNVLEEHARDRNPYWKSNVKAMTKQWLEMGLRPRAVTRDLDWGISLPLEGAKWEGKCVYVWFEAVQGYYSCARIWSERFGQSNDWEKWWKISENGVVPRHLYFLGKDNIPFHTVIWPALICGLNHANNGLFDTDEVNLPGPGDLALESNVPAMEYLMLAGGQFSKSRKHAVWLPSFLEKFDPDTLRYYLSINMPENHDTDFNWKDFVERVNSELIAAYGNFVHRVMSLTHRIAEGEVNPLIEFEEMEKHKLNFDKLEKIHLEATNSLKKHRYKEALRHLISAAQLGNQVLQSSTPWKYLNSEGSDERTESLSSLFFGWKLCKFLAITTQPFLPFSAQKLWEMLGESGDVSEELWSSAINWDSKINWNSAIPKPLFERLDLEKIIEEEKSLAEELVEENSDTVIHSVKGGKKVKKMSKEIEGIAYVDFETFMKVELRVGKISSVEEHPNADKLMVVNLDDGSESGRIICAGLKEYYTPDEMNGMHVIFVANLEPRKLRGIQSEGMLLAADDESGNVKLLTVDSSMKLGSRVR